MFDEEVIAPPVEPAAEKTVQFYEDTIPVVRLADGKLYVPLKPITDALGLSSFSSQRQRVLRDEVMAADVQNVKLASARGVRSMLAIPLQQLPGFLFGVDTSRVKVELRAKLIRYKREAFDVLWQAFAGEPAAPPALPTPTTLVQLPDDALTPAERDLKQAVTIYQLAIARVELERRQAENETRGNDQYRPAYADRIKNEPQA